MSVAENMEKDFIPIVKDLGYELVYVEYVKEGQDWFLRFFIDKPEGIDLNDCEKVSREVELLLDEKEYIKGQYILEVSSLGLERPLRKPEDYLAAIGEWVEVSLYRPLNKKKKYQGRLLHYSEELILEVDGLEIRLDLENISKANLSIEF